MKTILAIAFVLTACGSRAPTTPSDSNSSDTALSLAVETLADMPVCGPTNSRQLVWVEETKQFFVCKGETWNPIEIAPAVNSGARGDKGIQGPQGEKGEQGTQGLQGPQGERGEKGDRGTDGRNGTDGVDGQDGLNGRDGIDGADGVDGQDAPYVHVYRGTFLIGKLDYLNPQTNVADVIHTSGLRLQLRMDNGASYSEVQHFFYSGMNCTGEMKMGEINGRFANTAFNPVDSKWYKKVGRPVSSRFDYVSYSRYGSACANGGGFLSTHYTTQEATEISGLVSGALFLE